MANKAPLTLLVTRRIKPACHQAFHQWISQGETLASQFQGYLGSGLFSPPPGEAEWQILFRFADQTSLDAWANSIERQQWLANGRDLVEDSQVHFAQGLHNWFGINPPPRWKQAVMIWLVFFPVSLCFSLLLGDRLASLPVLLRVLCSTLMLTPIMVFIFIPFSSRLLHKWLQAPRSSATVFEAGA